jgi:hypothetical protein
VNGCELSDTHTHTHISTGGDTVRFGFALFFFCNATHACKNSNDNKEWWQRREVLYSPEFAHTSQIRWFNRDYLFSSPLFSFLSSGMSFM